MTLVSVAFADSASASTTTGNPTLVGLWHLDKIEASGDNVVTPDAASYNNGILGGDSHPALVDGEFDKALSFDGVGFVYVPIDFLVGFPPAPISCVASDSVVRASTRRNAHFAGRVADPVK